MLLLSIQSRVCSRFLTIEIQQNRIYFIVRIFFFISGPGVCLIEGVRLIGGQLSRGFAEVVQRPLRIIDGLHQFIT